MDPRISAIIITHNRVEYLIKAIQSLLHQSLPKDQYEIIVVDNCSTDHTRETVEKLSANNKVRYVFEPELGSSKSRNTGLQHARGTYVAFLDDDVITCPDWLEKILHVFETVQPRPGCVGGRVVPIWESERPEWLSDSLLLSLALIDWSESPHVIDDLKKEHLVSASIAFPTGLLKETGGFNTKLGRFGKDLLSNEDTFLQREIMRRGYSCYYDPEIVVRHHIFESRLSQSFFMRRYYWQGISDSVMQLMEHDTSRLDRYSSALSKVKYLFNSGKARRLLHHTNDPDEFTQRCWAFTTLGEISGLLRGVHQ